MSNITKTPIRTLRTQALEQGVTVYAQGGQYVRSSWNEFYGSRSESNMGPYITTERAALEQVLGLR